jgi:thiamine kinase-like enzyme
LGLFDDPSLDALPLIIAHNDLNATNFLKDVRKMQYHLIDFEFAGLNYPGYELANFFKEMEWDYTYPEPPYFKIRDGWDSDLKLNFIKEYWRVFADS